MLHLHVHLAQIVAAFTDGLDGEFLQCHLPADDNLECLDGGIDRTITRGCGLELLARDAQTDTGHRTDTLTGGHLQVLEFDVMEVGTVGSSENQNVIVGDFLLLVGQLEEFLIDIVEFLAVNVNTVD